MKSAPHWTSFRLQIMEYIMGEYQEKNYIKDAINVLVMDIFLIVMVVGSIIYSSAGQGGDHAPEAEKPAAESSH